MGAVLEKCCIRRHFKTHPSLINDVLDYSKIESGHLELEDQPFNLPNCIEEAMDIVSAPLRDTTVQFFTTVDPRLPAIVRGDVTRLRQVIINLIGNAVKFTESGYVWLEAKKVEVAGAGSDYVRIAIRDTGIGIPEDRRNRLFKTFSQVDSSMTRRYGGTGLGLAISQKLANAMGGLIEVESKVGVGSTFHFAIPIRSESGETLANYPSPCPDLRRFTFHLDFGLSQFQEAAACLLESWNGEPAEVPQSADFVIVSTAHCCGLSEAQEHLGERIGQYPAAKRILLHCLPSHVAPLKKTFDGDVCGGALRLSDVRLSIQSGLYSRRSKPAKAKPQKEKLLPPDVRILLAEDNKLNQKVFRLLMKREGYAIDIANDGSEALALVKKQAYGLIFMDLQMPEMDGLEATRAIRAMGGGIQQPWIIGFTANVESDAAPAMREAGMDDYLPKPVKDERVQAKLVRFSEEWQKQHRV